MTDKQGCEYGIITEDNACAALIHRILVEDSAWRCCFHYPSLETFMMSGESVGRIRFLLLDVQLSGLSGELCIEIFRRILVSRTMIVLLGQGISTGLLMKILKRGADGFLSKDWIDEHLGSLLWRIRSHGILLTPDVAEKLTRKLFVESQVYQEPGLLSPMEWAILFRLAEGDTYEVAAMQLGLTLNTFRYHIKKLFKTLHVDSSKAAVSWYQKRALEDVVLKPATGGESG